jgi:hypothetical protein
MVMPCVQGVLALGRLGWGWTFKVMSIDLRATHSQPWAGPSDTWPDAGIGVRSWPMPGSFLGFVSILAMTLVAGGWELMRARADVRAFAGCYAFSRSGGTGVFSAEGRSGSDSIRLELAPEPYARRWFNARALAVRAVGGEGSAPGATPWSTTFWAPGWGETILLQSFDGFVGLSMRLERVGSDLQGTVGWSFDVVSADPAPMFAVVGKRISCPSAGSTQLARPVATEASRAHGR